MPRDARAGSWTGNEARLFSLLTLYFPLYPSLCDSYLWPVLASLLWLKLICLKLLLFFFLFSKYSNHLIQQAILTQTQERKAILMLLFVVQKRLGEKKKKKKNHPPTTFTTKRVLRGEKRKNFFWGRGGEKTQRRFACFHLLKKQHKCIYLENECMTFTSGLGFSIMTKS